MSFVEKSFVDVEKSPECPDAPRKERIPTRNNSAGNLRPRRINFEEI